MLFSVVRLLAIVLYLLVGTATTIKGTLPIGSRQLVRQRAMLSSHGNVSSVSSEENTGDEARETLQERNGEARVTSNEEREIDQERNGEARVISNEERQIDHERNSAVGVASNEQRVVSSSLSSHLANGIAIAQDNVVETWKVYL